MLPRFKMRFVKLKSDEKVQEKHQNANCKKVPSGGHQNAGRQEELVRLAVMSAASTCFRPLTSPEKSPSIVMSVAGF
jgi:hypothetical protein